MTSGTSCLPGHYGPLDQHLSHIKHSCASTIATHRYLWCSRTDLGQRISGAHELISVTLLVPALCLDIWLGPITCLFRSALVSVVSFYVVVGPSLFDGTALVGGPTAGQALQRCQVDNFLVPVPSFACMFEELSRAQTDHQTPSKEAATVAAV